MLDFFFPQQCYLFIALTLTLAVAFNLQSSLHERNPQSYFILEISWCSDTERHSEGWQCHDNKKNRREENTFCIATLSQLVDDYISSVSCDLLFSHSLGHTFTASLLLCRQNLLNVKLQGPATELREFCDLDFHFMTLKESSMLGMQNHKKKHCCIQLLRNFSDP